MFDTLAYASKLKEAGLTDKQAKVHANAMISAVNENLATKMDIELVKRDIKELEVSLRRDMKEMETALRHDIELVKKDIKELELKFEGQFTLLKWMLGVTIAGTLSLVLKTFFG